MGEAALRDRGAADPRQFEWLRRAVRVAEGPAVALVAGIPFERDLRPVEIGKTQDAVAENERQGGKPGVDFLRREELLRARPCRVRDAYVLGIEFDVERREIVLEIAADIDLALKLRRCQPLERTFRETALRSEEHTSELKSLM